MQWLDYPQRSEEWYKARLGLPTASNFDKIVTTTGEPSKQREKYLMKLAGELATGKAEESYTNSAMQHGIDTEEEARNQYAFISGNEVELCSLCVTDICGASPDGLIGEDGILEIKCPQIPTQVEYLINGTLPSTYFQQVQGQLYVTGRKWCDFFAYYPDLKPLLVRVCRDEGFIKALETELIRFNKDLKEMVKKIT